MQQGRAKARGWIFEWEPSEARRADPLMGWIGSGDTRRQVQIRFDTKEAAIAFAEEKGVPYVVRDANQRSVRLKSYADNFRW